MNLPIPLYIVSYAIGIIYSIFIVVFISLKSKNKAPFWKLILNIIVLAGIWMALNFFSTFAGIATQFHLALLGLDIVGTLLFFLFVSNLVNKKIEGGSQAKVIFIPFLVGILLLQFIGKGNIYDSVTLGITDYGYVVILVVSFVWQILTTIYISLSLPEKEPGI